MPIRPAPPPRPSTASQPPTADPTHRRSPIASTSTNTRMKMSDRSGVRYAVAVRRPPLAEMLGLEPHPEGGWFRQTWRTTVTFTPDGYDGPRHAATAIYYALHPGERSAPHL